MSRAFLIVMDSVGIGGAPDADQFFNGDIPDSGANTLGHIRDWYNAQRKAPLHLPNLLSLGLGQAMALADTYHWDDLPALNGRWGVGTEISPGKDTPSGHWELAGLPVPWDWHYFTEKQNSFPPDLIKAVCQAAGTEGILGNCHASGTQIIAELGAEHIRTGWPICYTSADSVFQIAAHEVHFGLERLLQLCMDLAPILHEMRVGRVIARPFIGEDGAFERTGNRKDFAIPPPGKLLMHHVQEAGGRVIALGKIWDIFSGAGIDEATKGSDAELMQALSDCLQEAPDGSLTFANFVEFDSLYGHRRDPAGYGAHLEWFDTALGQVLAEMRQGDILVITADHGNDPTWPGTDHTRERVPVLVAGQGPGVIGEIGFTGVAEVVKNHLRLIERVS